MPIDPNGQVALASVLATTITTLGVVAVAYINNRKVANTPTVDDMSKLDEKDVLGRMLYLIADGDRKEEALKAAVLENKALLETNRALLVENSVLKTAINLDGVLEEDGKR